MELCSGGIIGMGESDADVVDMAFALRELGVESIPVNFLNPIDGTPLAGAERAQPALLPEGAGMFRLVNPDERAAHRRRPRAAPGQLAAAGPCIAANSIFVGDYLTTKASRPRPTTR